MNKYIALNRNGNVLYPIENCSYIKAGWRKPSVSYQIGDWGMKHPIKNPPVLYKAMISVPGLNTWANKARLVPPEIEAQLDDIDRQIKELRIKRQKLLDDEFLTFPLVQESDLKPSYENKDRYDSRQLAIKASKGGE